MKKVLFTIVMVLGLTAFAQKGDGHKGRQSDWKDMSPEQMATLKTKKMTLALDLSDPQQKEVQQMNLTEATSRQARMQEWKAKKESTEFKKPTSQERYEMKIALLDSQISKKEKMKSILSEEQYQKWERMHSKMAMHHKKGHDGKIGRRK
ncbi:MAG: hypothetical protein V7724_17070 [Sediminicola sp.]